MHTHRPTDCALLFAIPLTREEFFADAQEYSGKEYARLFRRQLSGLSDKVVWERYEAAVVDAAVSTLEAASRHGVLTHTQVTAETWRATLGQRQVVSLVAHWHSAGFTAETVKESSGRFLREIEFAQGTVGRAMSHALTMSQQDVKKPEVLADVLNALLRHSPLVPGEPQENVKLVANDEEQILDWNFETVRQEFPQWRLQPSGMELADGIHSAAEMVSTTICGEYIGTLDLRMCHSVILGEAVKRAAPRCRVVMNQYPVRPGVQLPMYKAILEMLEAGNYSFAAAVVALHKAVLERLR